jgi:hypothetical protein
MRRAPRLADAFLAAATLALPAHATWSIVAVDSASGEVCVATATCLVLDIQPVVPLIRVGVGAAATQGLVVPGDKVTIWNGFTAGLSPADILAQLGGNASQYGIVDFVNPPVTFTGQNTISAALGVTGQQGTLRYAIQGNILTGAKVVNQAEQTLLTTPGDLGQRVLAAMKTAQAFGGDGRCSCSPIFPTSCGSPPPSFQKSAHTGTILLARMGDTDGSCTAGGGCVNGSYYLNLNYPGKANNPDPVDVLGALYKTWRKGLKGRPDHILSTVATTAPFLPADGKTGVTIAVGLVDVNGVPLPAGGATLTVAGADGTSPTASIGAVTDHGDGTYSFRVTAGTAVGAERLAITADDGTVSAQLWPPLELGLEPPAALHVGFRRVSASTDAAVPITIDLGPAHAGEAYRLLASKSGTTPGVPIPGGLLPLNPDALTAATLGPLHPSLLRGASGVLDADGRAAAGFVATAAELAGLAGLRVDFAAVSHGATPTATNADGFTIVP